MARMKASLRVALGVIFAIALTPRAALANDYVKFEYTDLSLAPLERPAADLNFTLNNSSLVYPLLPYSLPYTDSTSSSYSESGSAHTDLLLTEESVYIDLASFDAKIKFTFPTLRLKSSSIQTGFSGINSGNNFSGTFTWPSQWTLSSNTYSEGPWTVDGYLYDSSGYHYSKDGQLVVNEHDITGSGATDYASSGVSTGLIQHEKFLADGLYFSECPFPSASSDGFVYFFLGFGSSRWGANNNYFKKGTRFYAYSSQYIYWADDWNEGNPYALHVFGWGARSGTLLSVFNDFDYNSFTIPFNADAVGLVLRCPASSVVWSDKVVIRPPSIYMVDPSVENTITVETEEQTDTLMDTTGSDSVLSGLTAGGVQGFNQKLGFLGQIGTVANTFNSSLTNASANSVVQFPGIVVQGITLVPAQGVDIWQNGLDSFEQPVKMAFTFAFVAAWVNGMKRLLDYQILGEPYSGEVQE